MIVKNFVWEDQSQKQFYNVNNYYNPTCITVYIENTRYSSYVLFCNTTVNSQ